MLDWSEKFETQIKSIDVQHKNLVAILNELCTAVSERSLNQVILDSMLKRLSDYAINHFTDEELLMVSYQVSEKHVIIHKMEHNSFIYDIDRMCNYFAQEDNIIESGEKLVQFITAWLTYHMLGIDKVLVAQINDIKQGVNPEKAYQRHKNAKFDIITTRLLLEAVLKMWRESNRRNQWLEQQLIQGSDNKKSPFAIF
jgi:hemerythrin-like metal-binding protein